MLIWSLQQKKKKKKNSYSLPFHLFDLFCTNDSETGGTKKMKTSSPQGVCSFNPLLGFRVSNIKWGNYSTYVVGDP